LISGDCTYKLPGRSPTAFPSASVSPLREGSLRPALTTCSVFPIVFRPRPRFSAPTAESDGGERAVCPPACSRGGSSFRAEIDESARSLGRAAVSVRACVHDQWALSPHRSETPHRRSPQKVRIQLDKRRQTESQGQSSNKRAARNSSRRQNERSFHKC
jgi:hypothetical protein